MNTIEENIHNKLEKLIKDFLESDSRELDINMFPIKMFMDTFESLGWEWDGNLDTNGWSVDFWLKFVKDGKEIGLNGSWWDGEYNLEKLWM